MITGLHGRLMYLLAGVSIALVATAASAQDRDRDSYIAQAKTFGLDIGYASYCELDPEKLKAFANAGMDENLPQFDDEEFNASIIAEFEAAMRGAAETEPQSGCDAHLAKIAPRIP